MILVRLADGFSWDLQGAPMPAWGFDQILGITCDDAFFTVSGVVGGDLHLTIARIRHSSLGAPTPPD